MKCHVHAVAFHGGFYLVQGHDPECIWKDEDSSLMPMFKVPVECPECHQQSLVINPGDKYYCLNDKCLYQSRLPTDPGMTLPDNKRVFNYYVRKLEEQVLQFRNVDPQKFRNGDDDGRPKPVFNKDWESMRLIMPDPEQAEKALHEEIERRKRLHLPLYPKWATRGW